MARKLLADLGLDIAPELAGLALGFLVASVRGFHRFLLSHGFALFHVVRPRSPLAPHPGAGPHLALSRKTLQLAYGSMARELFSNGHVRRLERRLGSLRWNCLDRPRAHLDSGGILVDITSRHPASAVLAPLCPRPDRQPALRRRLCGRDPGGPDRRSQACWTQAGSPRVALYRLFTKIWNSVALNGKSEPTPTPSCRSSSGSARSRRCRGRPSCWSRWRAFRGGRRRRSSISTCRPLRAPGRGIRPRARRRDRHRRADHRGRDLHRHGPRRPGRKPRPSRARRRPHPSRGGDARQDQAAGPDPRRHPARRRQLRPRRGQRAAAARSRCR